MAPRTWKVTFDALLYQQQDSVRLLKLEISEFYLYKMIRKMANIVIVVNYPCNDIISLRVCDIIQFS